MYPVKKCKRCKKTKHLTHYKPYSKHKRVKHTVTCYACRQKLQQTKYRPNTKLSKCKKQWEEWKRNNKCVDCGISDPDVLQADHYIGQKEKELSNYTYWSIQGPDKQLEEFKKTRCLCRFCHNISTRKDYFKLKSNRLNTKKSRRDDKHKQRKMQYVLEEKLRRGQCRECNRKVTPETSNCFIFDHAENHTKKKMAVSSWITQNRSGFKNGIIKLEREMNLCQMLCSNCDWKKTRKELWGHRQIKPWEEEKQAFYNF